MSNSKSAASIHHEFNQVLSSLLLPVVLISLIYDYMEQPSFCLVPETTHMEPFYHVVFDYMLGRFISYEQTIKVSPQGTRRFNVVATPHQKYCASLQIITLQLSTPEVNLQYTGKSINVTTGVEWKIKQCPDHSESLFYATCINIMTPSFLDRINGTTDDFLFFTGGYNNLVNLAVNTTKVYDRSQDQWITYPNMIHSRYAHIVCQWKNKIFVWGGKGNTTHFGHYSAAKYVLQCEVFEDGKWKEISGPFDHNTSITYISAIAISTGILLKTTHYQLKPSNTNPHRQVAIHTLWYYDPATQIYHPLTIPFPSILRNNTLKSDQYDNVYCYSNGQLLQLSSHDLFVAIENAKLKINSHFSNHWNLLFSQKDSVLTTLF